MRSLNHLFFLGDFSILILRALLSTYRGFFERFLMLFFGLLGGLF